MIFLGSNGLSPRSRAGRFRLYSWGSEVTGTTPRNRSGSEGPGFHVRILSSKIKFIKNKNVLYTKNVLYCKFNHNVIFYVNIVLVISSRKRRKRLHTITKKSDSKSQLASTAMQVLTICRKSHFGAVSLN